MLKFHRLFWIWITCQMTFSLVKAEDLVVLKTLDEIEGKVIKADATKVYIQIAIQGGSAQSAYRLDQIEKIVFASPFDRSKLSADPTKRLEEFNSLLTYWQSFLKIPESATGEILFAQAETLIELKRFEEALKSINLIQEQDWSKDRKLRVAPVKIKCLAGLNRFEEAMAMAKELESQANDSSTVAFVQMVLGEVAFSRTNYFEALDHFLYNRVFNPTLKEEAGRGLWNASRVYLAQTNYNAAARVLKDITTDYPQSSVFAQAQTKLKEIQPFVKPEEEQEREKVDVKQTPPTENEKK